MTGTFVDLVRIFRLDLQQTDNQTFRCTFTGVSIIVFPTDGICELKA
jgi:hypothetical protein